MPNNDQITKEDALFYLDMINSKYGPTYKPKRGQSKGYYPLLKEKDSKEYNRFIRVYVYFKHNLKEREQTILNLQYGINSNVLSLGEIGESIGVTSSRVSQLRNRAERRLASIIRDYVNGMK
ncbi:sigma factor-like helix-turn-helix DNA-binding protein [Bacillaceae bacterium S4-13-56]